jgi:hypothetical protein
VVATLDVVVQLTPRGIECVPDRDVHVFVGAIAPRLAADHDAGIAGQRDLDAHLVDVSVAPSSPRSRERDAALGDPIAVGLELGRARSDLGFDRRRRRHLLERDVNGVPHDGLE